MSDVTLTRPDADLTRKIEAFFADPQAREGYVLNYFRAHDLNPDNLAWFNSYLLPLLDPAGQRRPEAGRVRIAMAGDRCSYCHANHVANPWAVADDQARARRTALGYGHVAEFSVRERALADLSVKLTRDPDSVTDEDIQELRAIGLDDSDILDAVEVAARFETASHIPVAL